jgi:hypothetical protein
MEVLTKLRRQGRTGATPTKALQARSPGICQGATDREFRRRCECDELSQHGIHPRGDIVVREERGFHAGAG